MSAMCFRFGNWANCGRGRNAEAKGHRTTRAADREVQRCFGRFQIPLHHERRGVQGRTGVVEAVRRALFRQLIDQVGLDAQQVANRVLIFDTIQAANDDAPFFRPAGQLGSCRFGVDPRGQEALLVDRRPRLVFRWHLVEFDAIGRLAPFGGGGTIERAAQFIEPQFAFLLIRAVTPDTIFLQQRLNLSFKRRRLRGLRRDGNTDRTNDGSEQQSAK